MRVRFRYLLALPALLLFACAGGATPAPPRPLASSPPPASTPSSGPIVSIDPRSGPRGTEVTVSGSGWPGGVEVVLTSASATAGASPYARVKTMSDGSFSAHFRLDSAPDGRGLPVGRFEMVARAGAIEVPVTFQVESPRPVGGGGQSG